MRQSSWVRAGTFGAVQVEVTHLLLSSPLNTQLYAWTSVMSERLTLQNLCLQEEADQNKVVFKGEGLKQVVLQVG